MKRRMDNLLCFPYGVFVSNMIYCCRDAYMAYQRRRIGEIDDERVKFEISTMLSREVSVGIFCF